MEYVLYYQSSVLFHIGFYIEIHTIGIQLGYLYVFVCPEHCATIVWNQAL